MPMGNDEYNEEHVFDANSSSGFFSSSRSSPRSQSGSGFDVNAERFSRKVFVGGLPPDIDEDEITASFRRFGPLVVDWPHKAESKSYFPPKGYAFLLFQVKDYTVWKFLDFSVIQILREINFGESRSSKTAVFAILGALNFVNLVHFSLQKVQKFMINQNSEPLNVVKWLILNFTNPQN